MKAKRLAAALLVVVMGFSQFSTALADKKSDAQNKKQEAEDSLKEKNAEMDKIKKEQDKLQGEINSLDKELVQVIVDLSTLEEDLAIKEDQLEQTKADLEQARIDEQNQYEAMKKRIQYMYEQGDTSMLTSFLESKSISDLLNKVEYVNQMYGSDRELLTKYQDTKQQVQDLEVQQETEVAALQAKQQEYQAAAENYKATIARKQGTMGDFSNKLEQAKNLAAKYQDTISQQNTIIAKAEAEEKAAAEKAAKEKAAKEKAAKEKAAQEAAQKAAEEANKKKPSTPSGGTGGGSTGGDSGSKDPGYTTGVSGSKVVSYALGFVGNPYVWGGKDPNTGADCSGFTSYVYAHFGISIPSQSYSQRSAGREVSYENAQPGDLICYEGHVAIYMGNGQIVHAKGTAYGIVAYDRATYRNIITVRRLL